MAGNLSIDYKSQVFSATEIPWVSGLLIGLYTVISVFGTLANITVIVVLRAHKAMNNITNIFVLVLASSDIILLSFNVPLQTYYQLVEASHLTDSICRILFSLYGLPMYVSCLTILLIAIDRYRMIIYPLKPRITRTIAMVLILVVLTLSIVNSIPIVVVTKADMQYSITFCVEHWQSWPNGRLIYTIYIFVMQFGVPLFITAILYFRIYLRLRRRKITKSDDKRKRKTNQILISIVVCFAICWSPWMSNTIIIEFRGVNLNAKKNLKVEDISLMNMTADMAIEQFLAESAGSSVPRDNTKIIDSLLKAFAMTSAIVNPFLYGWLNDSIREEMIRLYNKIRGRKAKLDRTERTEIAQLVTIHNNGKTQLQTTRTNETTRLAPTGLEEEQNCRPNIIVHSNGDGDRQLVGLPSQGSIEWADCMSDQEESGQNNVTYDHYVDGPPHIPPSAQTVSLSDKIIIV